MWTSNDVVRAIEECVRNGAHGKLLKEIDSQGGVNRFIEGIILEDAKVFIHKLSKKTLQMQINNLRNEISLIEKRVEAAVK
jgi:hypothetical protein